MKCPFCEINITYATYHSETSGCVKLTRTRKSEVIAMDYEADKTDLHLYCPFCDKEIYPDTII